MLEFLGVAVIALSAIVSPLITNYMNQRHSRKMRDQEIFEKRIQTYEKFLTDYGHWTIFKDGKEENHSESLYPAYFHCGDITRQKIETLMTTAKGESHRTLLEVAKSLAENELNKK